MEDKIQKIRGEVERLMYGFNMEADIASCEDAETEKLADIKYQLCKKIFGYIDKVQEEPESKELEKEIDLYFAKWLQGASDEGCFNPESQLVSIYDCHRIARYFANWQRDQILNRNATLLRTFELGKIEMKQQVLKAMDLGEPPYLISVEKAYYDVKKLLEG